GLRVLSTIDNIFWDVDTAGVDDGVGTSVLASPEVVGVATARLMDPDTFGVAWDFGGIWEIVDGVSYPYLKSHFPLGLSILSGQVQGISNGTEALRVDWAVDGTPLGWTYTGANGFYYAAFDPIDPEGVALTWLDGARLVGGAVD